ncbi:MAG: hypothetical protein JWP63_4623 [Candidatus Solibacter sp.]|nr:hypothetical protein [Candidatus Solibacter sp.]
MPAAGEGVKTPVEASEPFPALLGGFVAADGVVPVDQAAEANHAPGKLSSLERLLALAERVKDTKKPAENSSAVVVAQPATSGSPPPVPDKADPLENKVAADAVVKPDATAETEQAAPIELANRSEVRAAATQPGAEPVEPSGADLPGALREARVPDVEKDSQPFGSTPAADASDVPPIPSEGLPAQSIAPVVVPVPSAAPTPLPNVAPQRRQSRSAVEEILPFRPPVTQADVPPPAAPAAEGGESEAPPTAFGEWLKSPAAGEDRPAASKPEIVRPSAPMGSAIKEVGEGKVRSVNVATPDRGEIAFEAHIQPVDATSETTPAASVRAPLTEPRKEFGTSVPQPSPEVREEAPLNNVDIEHSTPEHERKPAVVERSRSASASEPKGSAIEEVPQVKMPTHAAQPGGQPGGQPGAAPNGPREETGPDSTPDAANVQTREAPKTGAKPEVQAGSARDIKLEVSDGEHRLEVRLSERGGEVRVAVRTADSHLAGELRDNLPQLASRLAENGMRSELWRPTDAHAGNLSQEGDSQSRGQFGDTQGDAEQRQAQDLQDLQEQKTHKEKGKDFAWLMSSLR